MAPIVFFHRADFDGVCSAAIVKKFVPDVELYGIDYGDPFPWSRAEPQPEEDLTQEQFEEQDFRHRMERRTVYMVDFSLKPDEMKRLSEVADLVWCDHHKSALESCVGLDIRGVRSTALAGCELAWEWFASMDGEGMMPPPEAVRLLGRYDVWDSKNPDWPRIEAFQFGMRATPGAMDPMSYHWDCLLNGCENADGASVSGCVASGQAILSYRDREAKSLCADGAHVEAIGLKDYVPVRPDGGAVRFFRLVCLNSLSRGSWQFNSVWDPEKHDAMCVYGQLKDGRWRVSLYSTKEEVDCGAVCKALGGGGHKGAAGFICDELPWEK